jgi:hypothetical protein
MQKKPTYLRISHLESAASKSAKRISSRFSHAKASCEERGPTLEHDVHTVTLWALADLPERLHVALEMKEELVLGLREMIEMGRVGELGVLRLIHGWKRMTRVWVVKERGEGLRRRRR